MFQNLGSLGAMWVHGSAKFHEIDYKLNLSDVTTDVPLPSRMGKVVVMSCNQQDNLDWQPTTRYTTKRRRLSSRVSVDEHSPT